MMPRFLIRVGGVALAGLVACVLGCSTRSQRTSARPKAPAKNASRRAPTKAETADFENRVKAYAHYATAFAHDLNENTDEALEHYYASALANPDYSPVVTEAAQRLLRAQQAPRAVELLRRATAKPDSSGVLHAWLGLAYANAGRTDEAIEANRVAIQKMPTSLAPYQNLVQIFLRNSRTNDALAVLDQASAQSVEDAGFYLELGELYLRLEPAATATATNAPAWPRARASLDRSAALKPTRPVLVQRLAEGYARIGDVAKTEAYYLDLIKQFPHAPAFRARLADLYLSAGNKAKASEQLAAIVREDPTNPQTHFFLGNLAMEQDQLDESVEHLNRALLLNPDLEPAYYELAIVRLRQKKPAEAWAHLESARQRFKLNFALEFYSALTQSALKDYPSAIKHFISAELIAKTSEPARLTHTFYFQMGAAYERNKEYALSETYFRKCLEIAPNFAEALNYLGYMWVENGVNLAEAKKMIVRAVELDPENAAFLDSLAWAYYKLNQPTEALTWMLKAMEHNDEPDATLYDHLGDIYAALHRFSEARDAWTQSLQLEPSDSVKAKLHQTPPDPAAP